MKIGFGFITIPNIDNKNLRGEFTELARTNDNRRFCLKLRDEKTTSISVILELNPTEIEIAPKFVNWDVKI